MPSQLQTSRRQAARAMTDAQRRAAILDLRAQILVLQEYLVNPDAPAEPVPCAHCGTLLYLPTPNTSCPSCCMAAAHARAQQYPLRAD